MPEPLRKPSESRPFEAVVWVPPGFDAGIELAGLSLLLRAVLCLQEAGARRVWLSGEGDAVSPTDPRIRVPVGRGEPSDGAALWLRADTTCHRALPARLAAVAARRTDDGLLRAGDGDDDGLWWVPAGRHAALRDALAAPQPPTHDELPNHR